MASCGADEAGNSAISVITRESGSGTRSAFIELFEVQDPTKVDQTTDTAVVSSSTAGVLTSVQSDANAIGYVSLGSLNDSVKAVQIDGVKPTVANVLDKSYKISRPFNIVTKDGLSVEAQDFVNYILSVEGQEVINAAGYIALENAEPYVTSAASGKIAVSGSSSVTPAMEKLVEAYAKVNPALSIELQTSDSTTGVNDAVDGRSEIGMSSRDLKDSEIAKGVKQIKIATDGLAVVVNKDNKIDSLTTEQVKDIYTGSTTTWSELEK
ncbi:phosphate-binding protein PstS 2 [Actinomycetota bacterium]|nr:phosphate-binding protein PstS 2 [Actinomycetota bacterium]